MSSSSLAGVRRIKPSPFHRAQIRGQKMIQDERKPETATMAEDTEIEVPLAIISGALIFHVVYDVLSFLLYMHQQIPSMLQDMTLQFDALQTEYKESDMILAQSELNASFRRKCIGRKRDIKLEIRRMEKLMNAISGFQNAFRHLIFEVPNIEGVIFAFGATPRRPQHVYELLFPHGGIASLESENMTKNRSIEMLSRKVIRALISKGVGTVCYTGPSKLFLLVKAPKSFNMPQHFLPKRDFQYSKKVSVSACNQGHCAGKPYTRRIKLMRISKQVFGLCIWHWYVSVNCY